MAKQYAYGVFAYPVVLIMHCIEGVSWLLTVVQAGATLAGLRVLRLGVSGQ